MSVAVSDIATCSRSAGAGAPGGRDDCRVLGERHHRQLITGRQRAGDCVEIAGLPLAAVGVDALRHVDGGHEREPIARYPSARRHAGQHRDQQRERGDAQADDEPATREIGARPAQQHRHQQQQEQRRRVMHRHAKGIRMRQQVVRLGGASSRSLPSVCATNHSPTNNAAASRYNQLPYS